MKKSSLMVAAAAFLVLAGCEGRADENGAAAAENVVEDLGAELENAAGDAVNAAEDVGAAVANGAEAVANDVSDADSNEADNSH
jgi:uncharacterized lipoprotein NlpE involved in copper resistance